MNTEFNKIIKSFKSGGHPFAVTGSWAAKLHAEKKGQKMHRPPHDFDFAVHGSNFETFISKLHGLGYGFGSNMPLITPKRIPDRVTMKKNKYEVDLLKAGGRLAPRLNRPIKYKNIPLASVSNMMKQKQNILGNLYNNKANKNLKFLIKLLSPMKKLPSPSPIKRLPSPNNKNVGSTRKKLSFD